MRRPAWTPRAASLAQSQKYSVSIYVQILHKGRNVTKKLGASSAALTYGCVRALPAGGGTGQGARCPSSPPPHKERGHSFPWYYFQHMCQDTRHHAVCGASLSYLSTLLWCLWGSDTHWERWERDVALPGPIKWAFQRPPASGLIRWAPQWVALTSESKSCGGSWDGPPLVCCIVWKQR